MEKNEEQGKENKQSDIKGKERREGQRGEGEMMMTTEKREEEREGGETRKGNRGMKEKDNEGKE